MHDEDFDEFHLLAMLPTKVRVERAQDPAAAITPAGKPALDVGGQGGRVAGGLGPVTPLGSVALILAQDVAAPTPGFLDSMADIEAAQCIPGVMQMAEVTYATAKDAKTYGALKTDPLA
eukprot:COSAG01_NODE_36404_length_518_cov_1.078759_1_plen_118_part_10